MTQQVTLGLSPLAIILRLQVRQAQQGGVWPKIINSRNKQDNLGTAAHESRLPLTFLIQGLPGF